MANAVHVVVETGATSVDGEQMLDAGGQPLSRVTEPVATSPQVCTLWIDGRQLGVELELVRELIPNPETHEVDVVVRVGDEVVTLGVDEVGRPIDLDQVESAGVEMLTPAQLLDR